MVSGLEMQEGEWTKVTRRQQKTPAKRRRIITFFVSNVPERIQKGVIWKIFGRFGTVKDVYFAKKKDAGRRFFAFVRFAEVDNERELESKLQRIMCEGPDQNRSYWSNFRDGRSFASVAAGSSRPQQNVIPPPPPPPPLTSEPIPLTKGTVISEWLRSDCTLIGEALSLDHIRKISPSFILGVESAFGAKYLGGLSVGLRFRSSSDVAIFLANKNIWCSSLDVSNGKVCICTESHTRINDERLITEGGRIFRIGVFEVDELWSPFNLPAMNEQVDSESESDEEEEDGISETIRHNSRNDELEDGEIGPEMATDMVSESKAEDVDSGDVPMSDGGSPGWQGLHGKCQESPREKQHAEVFNSPSKMERNIDVAGHVDASVPSHIPKDHFNGSFNSWVQNGCFGPFPYMANVGLGDGSVPRADLDLDSYQNNFGGSFIKRRRIKVALNAANTPDDQFTPNLDNHPEIHIQTQSLENSNAPSSSIDLNRNPPLGMPGISNDESPQPEVPEVELTAEVGKSVGFEIDKDNPILVEALGEAGVQTGLP
ncbi:hypothetical protein L2E82_36065 [Cichorium intybus]|uniref:Uncharacterized protein n=1 Tax=Cichorium intybus TaxID=13427 RepID=A0ACB9BQN2_CICIN|nr:hypothetical protein L2E82_36065 [Cichorium intybus]